MIIKKIKEVFSTNKKTMPSWLLSVLASLPLGGLGWAFTSCSDMLETESSRQVFDPQLNQKTDSVFYALGVLQGVQELADYYVLQGEMRGDLLQTTAYTDSTLRQLANFSATTANKYDSAYVYYRVINNCNYFIAHRDTLLRTGSKYVAMPEYIAIKAIRAWTYMQLARVYGTVAFFTYPLTQISQIDDFPNDAAHYKDMQGIVEELAPDLEQYTGFNSKGEYVGTELPNYGGNTPAGSGFNVNNVFFPVEVVLGEMYLETNRYAEAARCFTTYLTQVSSQPSSAYYEPVTTRGLGDILPSNWDRNTTNTYINNTRWSDIFLSSNQQDLITYIPLNSNVRYGAITNLPLYFGIDLYSNEPGFVDEIQVKPSDSYLALSNSQDYYYATNASTAQNMVVSSARLGDTRYQSLLNERSQGDSLQTWVMKYATPQVRVYRTSTVMLRLAEAYNRMGYYDAAFAILKDGINPLLLMSSYLKLGTRTMLYGTLLSPENQEKFATKANFYGIHSHGAGITGDATFRTEISIAGGQSPYQLDTIVGVKMRELAAQQGIAVGNTVRDSINAVEDLICDELALEAAFEGSRFYDLCRFARHKNADGHYGANYGSEWLARKLAFKKPVKDLTNPDNWYLPFK